MRALAHPARLAILEYLGRSSEGRGNEATATECAQVCGLSPSATSYHLRALARHGLVEEAPSRGDGRERVWRAAGEGVRIDEDATRDPEDLAAAVALLDVWFTREWRLAREWALRADETEPKEWADAAAVTGLTVTMTAEELIQVRDAVRALIEPYAKHIRPDPPAEARRVSTIFVAFPRS
jgi:DNA-binding transcriptional ArsR family regulator